MIDKGSVSIGTWPTPEKPGIFPVDRSDMVILNELNDVFRKYGIEGKVKTIEFEYNTIGREGKRGPISHRIILPFDGERASCIWM